MNKVDNKDYLWYALYSFAGFGLEILLIIIENIFIKEQTTFTMCFHWILTSFLWGIVGYTLYKGSKDKLNYNLINDNNCNKNNMYIAFALVVIYSIINIIFFGFKPIEEFKNLGLVKFLFQYIYYIFETVLILLTISFGQKFFDKYSKNKYIPFGGIILACTWGLMHILTQNISTGIYAVISATIYGCVYILLNKNTKCSYLSILLMFIL